MEVSLRQIGYFIKLAERGSFTVAADALGITQPALSIAISQLEKAVGNVLFARGSQPLLLTEEGAIFHRYGLRIQRDLAEAREELHAFGSGTIGQLSIGMGPSASTPEVGAVLTSMASEFAELDITVHTGVMPAVGERLIAGEFAIYVGLLADDYRDPRLTISLLAPQRLLIVAAPDHPLVRMPRPTVGDLARAAWLAIGNVDANLPGWARLFDGAGLKPPRAAINVRNTALVRGLLLDGHFVTALPQQMVQPDLDAGILAAIAPERFDWTIPLVAVTRAGVTLPAAAQIFRDRLQAQFSATT